VVRRPAGTGRHDHPIQPAPVGFEPLRALPAGRLEEGGAQRLEARLERAEAQVARMLDRLERVDDVVDFPVLLGAARPDVGAGMNVRVEAVEVGLAEPHVTRGLALADVDADGRMEVVLAGDHETSRSTDNLGGVETPKSLDLYVDVDSPVTTVGFQGPFAPVGPTLWITPATSLWLNATDSESGVRETLYRYRVGAVWSVWSSTPIPLAPPVGSGPFVLEYFSLDNLNQSESVSSTSLAVDGVPPVSVLTVGSPASGGWVTSAALISIAASDAGVGVGPAATRYRTWHNGSYSP